MARIHNKRRNAGLVYELLLREATRCLVEGDEKRSKLALNIARRRFRVGTQLHRELRLFRALARTTAPSDRVAQAILDEARDEARRSDPVELDREKSLMLSEINKILGESTFHDRVPEYRKLASIQVLLNHWRRPTVGDPADVTQVALCEEVVRSGLLEKEETHDLTIPTGVDPLAVKIMLEKFNSQVSARLDEDQRAILRDYITSASRTDLKEKMEGARKQALAEFDKYLLTETNESVQERAQDVRRKIINLDLSTPDDSTVAKVLQVIQLRREIMQEVESGS